MIPTLTAEAINQTDTFERNEHSGRMDFWLVRFFSNGQALFSGQSFLLDLRWINVNDGTFVRKEYCRGNHCPLLNSVLCVISTLSHGRTGSARL